jgi:bifunctional UDP-N-acetylglucosamine pyrophosphorylase/glucosamine-1-phosphate N-acetyltransferase
VVCGDTPLIEGKTFKALMDIRRESKAAVAVLTAHVESPSGYGRVLREDDSADGAILSVIEEKDADQETKKIHEINTGAYCFDLKYLKEGLASLKPANAHGE